MCVYICVCKEREKRGMMSFTDISMCVRCVEIYIYIYREREREREKER